MDDMEQRYDNHFDEWIEEENENRHKLEQAKKNGYIHPHDPDYVAPEEPDAQ